MIPYKFTDTPVEVDNIITEPKSTSEVFIVLTENSVYSLDFTSIFTRTCDRCTLPLITIKSMITIIYR